ncbi:MAG: type II toxin-antitoxin system PemK/MazF family toxin, partial [Lachnospiraceae bacterium]|nr:type II toxin-antitoxin system PemK/MazF family toxin [Lachnospiraceae bacterium]
MNIDLTKTQQYLEWFKNKLYLNAISSSSKNRIVYRGQVYRCNLGVGIGSEECKERPCVILQYNSLGINHYYQTLQNMYNDKIQYIEKLKNNRSM